jgi:hypothetical protein
MEHKSVLQQHDIIVGGLFAGTQAGFMDYKPVQRQERCSFERPYVCELAAQMPAPGAQRNRCADGDKQNGYRVNGHSSH